VTYGDEIKAQAKTGCAGEVSVIGVLAIYICIHQPSEAVLRVYPPYETNDVRFIYPSFFFSSFPQLSLFRLYKVPPFLFLTFYSYYLPKKYTGYKQHAMRHDPYSYYFEIRPSSASFFRFDAAFSSNRYSPIQWTYAHFHQCRFHQVLLTILHLFLVLKIRKRQRVS